MRSSGKSGGRDTRMHARSATYAHTQRHARTDTHAHTACAVRWGRAGRSVSHPPPFPPPSRSVHVQAPVRGGRGGGQQVAPVPAQRRPCNKRRPCNRPCCWPCNTKRRGLQRQGGGRGRGTVTTVAASAAAEVITAAISRPGVSVPGDAGTTAGCKCC